MFLLPPLDNNPGGSCHLNYRLSRADSCGMMKRLTQVTEFFNAYFRGSLSIFFLRPINEQDFPINFC